MKVSPFLHVSAVAIALGACAPPPPSVLTPTPTPALKEAPLNWHLLDATEGVPGISLLRAERELLRGKEPRRTVVVAVIDNGLDTTHAALHSYLAVNSREVGGNNRDDDNNGYVDDVRGWNLIGGRDGRIVNQDTYELTRLTAQCQKGTAAVPDAYRQRCPEIRDEFARKRTEIDQTLANVRQIESLLTIILPMLRRATGSDSLTPAKVEALRPANDTIRQARDLYLRLTAAGIDPGEIQEVKKSYESQAQYGYNLTFDPRAIVGDDYPDTLVKHYGNPNVVGAGAEHGTHVAGIIAAGSVGPQPASESRGIARAVRVFGVRAVPDGDERDKDVALAIRYAVDIGANVINMSFGKPYSPYKGQVDAAIKYADSRGVLMVHGAGNDGTDNDTKPSFPNPKYLDGARAANWIEVGATSWKSGDSLVANFSNYGRTMVDVFAPGVDIYSTMPGGKYKKQSGTSMASPVVAGLAALLMSYYPNLSAADVKRVILESATKLGDRMVVRPGEAGGTVRFGDLSVTGGIVNAYAAIRLAEQMSAAKK